MTNPLAHQLLDAAKNRVRALHRLRNARPGSDEQREADRDFIICDRAYNEAKRAFEAQEFAP